jgi:hypothetical protein
MNVLYSSLEQNCCDTVISLPSPLQLEGKGVALVDVNGWVPRLAPAINENRTYYLCCDFIQPSLLQLEDGRAAYFPILRRITFSKKKRIQPRPSKPNEQVSPIYVSTIDVAYTKLLFHPVSRNEVQNFRLYLIDDMGRIPSFGTSNLKCTLVCIEYNRK